MPRKIRDAHITRNKQRDKKDRFLRNSRQTKQVKLECQE